MLEFVLIKDYNYCSVMQRCWKIFNLCLS